MGVHGGTKYYSKIGVYGALNLIVRWVYIVALNLTPILQNIYMGKKKAEIGLYNKWMTPQDYEEYL